MISLIAFFLPSERKTSADAYITRFAEGRDGASLVSHFTSHFYLRDFIYIFRTAIAFDLREYAAQQYNAISPDTPSPFHFSKRSPRISER